ncbi:MAG: sigma-70 family RNA polymerase sigma factor [Ruminococcus sp.]|nr:sigma-70 family RNA polymerase sigma factor [Ruminococcus sp.]MBR6968781.1 sigma-70 family RNA polymerase sigma factor [Ruminococcus sp.]
MNDEKWRELTRRALKGDSSAFGELYEASKKSVYFICLKMIGNENDAKDAMQNTYLTAYQKLGELDDGANFVKWVNGIAANKCREMFRIRSDDSLDEKVEEGVEFRDEEFIPEDYITDKAKRRIIMQIIERELTDVQRQTVILYYYNQLTVTQISQIMGCTDSAVKYRLCTARDKIREAVLIYEKEHDDRLHAIIPTPVLTKIFRAEAEELIVPDIRSAAVNAVSKSSANSITEELGGNQMKNAVIGKVVAGVAAGALAVGGLVFVLTRNSEPEKVKEVPSVESTAVSDTVTSAPAFVPEDVSSQEVSEASSTEGSQAAQFSFEGMDSFRVSLPEYKAIVVYFDKETWTKSGESAGKKCTLHNNELDFDVELRNETWKLADFSGMGAEEVYIGGSFKTHVEYRSEEFATQYHWELAEKETREINDYTVPSAASTQGDRYKKAYYFIIGENQVLVYEFICNSADKDNAVKAVETLFEHFYYPPLGN